MNLPQPIKPGRLRGGRSIQPRQVAFIALSAATFINVLGIGAVIPVLPLYVKGPIGAGDIAVGIVIGAFSITGILMRPIGGRIADRRGRKTVHIAGILICVVGAALLLVPAGVPGLIVSRLIVGFGEGWVFTAGVTWIVDLAPIERRGRVVGLFGLSIWGGITAGAVIGSLLLSTVGYEAVWWFALAAPILALLLASMIPRGIATEQAAAAELAAAELGSSAAALAEVDQAALAASSDERGLRRWVPSSTWRPGIALTLINVAYGTFMAFVVLLLDKHGIGHGAAVFTAFAASLVVTRLALGSLPDRVGPRPTALGAGLAQAAGLVVIATAGSLPLALAGAVLAGGGMSLIFPSLALIVIRNTDATRRGTALGAFTAFFDIGVGIGAPLAGIVASLGSGNNYTAAFIAAAGVSVIGTLIAFAVPKQKAATSNG